MKITIIKHEAYRIGVLQMKIEMFGEMLDAELENWILISSRESRASKFPTGTGVEAGRPGVISASDLPLKQIKKFQ